MAGLKIEKQELLTVRGSDGSQVKIDDIVVMRTYRENRYRVNSIADCKVVEHIEFRKGEEE